MHPGKNYKVCRYTTCAYHLVCTFHKKCIKNISKQKSVSREIYRVIFMWVGSLKKNIFYGCRVAVVCWHAFMVHSSLVMWEDTFSFDLHSTNPDYYFLAYLLCSSFNNFIFLKKNSKSSPSKRSQPTTIIIFFPDAMRCSSQHDMMMIIMIALMRQISFIGICTKGKKKHIYMVEQEQTS